MESKYIIALALHSVHIKESLIKPILLVLIRDLPLIKKEMDLLLFEVNDLKAFEFNAFHLLVQILLFNEYLLTIIFLKTDAN